MYLLDSFKNKYIIEGVLIADAPLSIGSGQLDFIPTASDSSVIKDENGNPFIPGSTLKGVLRSFLERLIGSGAFDEYRTCNILSDKESCIPQKKFDEMKAKIKDEKKLAEDIYKEECDICKLFGGHHFASKINFYDAKLVGDKASILIRDGVAIDRDTLTAAYSMKYDYECVAAGTKFDFKMTVDNLDNKQITLLKIIINYLESGDMQVGGKTSSGLGKISLIEKKIYCIDSKEELRNYYINNIRKECYLGGLE